MKKIMEIFRIIFIVLLISLSFVFLNNYQSKAYSINFKTDNLIVHDDLPVETIENTCLVSFDLNGVPGTPPSSYEVEEGGNAITPTEPYHEGYTFLGWLKNNRTQSSTNQPHKILEDIVISYNTKFYACWEVHENTVTWDWNYEGFENVVNVVV